VSLGAYQVVNVDKSLHIIFDKPNEYVSLASVGYWQMVFNSALAVTLFLAWIKVLHVTVRCFTYAVCTGINPFSTYFGKL